MRSNRARKACRPNDSREKRWCYKLPCRCIHAYPLNPFSSRILFRPEATNKAVVGNGRLSARRLQKTSARPRNLVSIEILHSPCFQPVRRGVDGTLCRLEAVTRDSPEPVRTGRGRAARESEAVRASPPPLSGRYSVVKEHRLAASASGLPWLAEASCGTALTELLRRSSL